jgi:hypothetical protein
MVCLGMKRRRYRSRSNRIDIVEVHGEVPEARSVHLASFGRRRGFSIRPRKEVQVMKLSRIKPRAIPGEFQQKAFKVTNGSVEENQRVPEPVTTEYTVVKDKR